MRLFQILALFAFTAFTASFCVAQVETKAAPESDEATAASAEKTAEKADDEHREYLRIQKDKDGRKLALQTSIVRYKGQPGTPYDGAVVDLVGVVHIGELDYYEQLNSVLSTYESVLYELVAPDGTRIRPEDLKKGRSIVSSMQTGMKDMLNLEYQLEHIDYMAKNFRHADMSPEEFSKDLARRGDSVVKMMARMMGAGLASQSGGGGDLGILMAMFSKDRSTAMKRAMANQLVQMESMTMGLNDANGDNTLIKGRNAKAFKVLKEELENGKESVAVFYGAGHLSDMADRLEKDFQMEPVRTNWFNAWNLSGQ